MLAKRCDVLIAQGPLYKNPKIVFEHELEILELHFGEGNVTPYERKRVYNEKGGLVVETDEVVTYPIVELDHEMEYGRLEVMYGMHPEIQETVCQHIHGRLKLKTMERLGEQKYRKEYKKQQEALPDDLEAADMEEGKELQRLGMPQLREVLKGMGQTFFMGASRAHLIAMINKQTRLEAGAVQ